MFLDVPEPSAIFSIHNLAVRGADLGTPLGQYFSPTILARVLRKQAALRHDIPFTIVIIKQGILPMDALRELMGTQGRPLLLLMTLRLGADLLNEEYGPLIKAALRTPTTLGILGGQAARAHYIVGYQEGALLYLDPHHLRPAALDPGRLVETGELHTRAVCELPLRQLDPTLLFGFLCRGEADLEQLRDTLTSVPLPMPLFTSV